MNVNINKQPHHVLYYTLPRPGCPQRLHHYRIAEPGPKGEIRLFVTIPNDLGRLEHVLGRIRKAHPGAQLELAYEAGPCGFVIARASSNLWQISDFHFVLTQTGFNIPLA